jgi:hypothetical protein
MELYVKKLQEIKNIPVLNQKALHYVFEQGLVFENDEKDDLWLEFGTYDGRSINPIAMYTDKTVYGFDSFSGLPEDWVGRGQTKGTFDLGGDDPNFLFRGIPFDLEGLKVCPNVNFIKGWFDDTLPKFMEENNKPISFIHLDSDIYSSAKCVFENTVKNIKNGCIIVFDELLSYPAFEIHEWKAWWEFVEKYDIEFEWIGGNVGGVDIPSNVTPKFAENAPLTPYQIIEGHWGISPSQENVAVRILKNPYFAFT